MREQFRPAEKQLATIKPNAHEQEKTAAIAALKVIRGSTHNLGINEEDLNRLEHRLEAYGQLKVQPNINLDTLIAQALSRQARPPAGIY